MLRTQQKLLVLCCVACTCCAFNVRLSTNPPPAVACKPTKQLAQALQSI